MKVALITGIPTPQRILFNNHLAEKLGDDFCIFYCALKEPNRLWEIQKWELKHRHYFLKSKMLKIKEDRYIHFNFSIWKRLLSFKPDAIVTVGFNPPMLLGWLYSLFYKKKHIPMSEGTLISEASLSKIHFLVRRIVYGHSGAFIASSKHTIAMFQHYGIPESKIFLSRVCIDNTEFAKSLDIKRKYDIMFSGQFIERKMPFFFVETAKKLKEKKPDLKVLLIGSGPLEDVILGELKKNKINYDFAGFIELKKLPQYYRSSRILLFPTKFDNWGIVANEACAVGTPVITCENAGVAGDLIIDGINGFVLPLDSNIWANKILELLQNEDLYEKMSAEAIKKIKEYNFDAARKGFINACLS